MALTIMGGLSVATFLTLFLLPSIHTLRHPLARTNRRGRPESCSDLPMSCGSPTPAE
jgi:hypothetical protein